MLWSLSWSLFSGMCLCLCLYLYLYLRLDLGLGMSLRLDYGQRGLIASVETDQYWWHTREDQGLRLQLWLRLRLRLRLGLGLGLGLGRADLRERL